MTQFSAAEDGVSAEPTEESFEVGPLSVRTVEVAGTYHTRIPPVTGTEVDLADFALFGATIEVEGDLHLLKCVAPAAVISTERSRLQAFVRSLTLSE